MPEEFIQYSSSENIATVTINRPAKRNAFTVDMCADLEKAWTRLRDSDDRVAILNAAGDVFTAGADLNGPPKDFWKSVPDLGIDIGKPILAVVNGPVIGMGVPLIAFCDLCIATEKARFVYPEARIGQAVGLISAVLPRMPHKVAMELMLLGEPLEAQRAYEVGFVNRVVASGEELNEARNMAKIIATSAPLVIRHLKRLSHQTLPRSPLEDMFQTQQKIQYVLQSDDAQEGIQAFKERRQPRFTGT